MICYMQAGAFDVYAAFLERNLRRSGDVVFDCAHGGALVGVMGKDDSVSVRFQAWGSQEVRAQIVCGA